jgi:hypothetical protein
MRAWRNIITYADHVDFTSEDGCSVVRVIGLKRQAPQVEGNLGHYGRDDQKKGAKKPLL